MFCLLLHTHRLLFSFPFPFSHPGHFLSPRLSCFTLLRTYHQSLHNSKHQEGESLLGDKVYFLCILRDDNLFLSYVISLLQFPSWYMIKARLSVLLRQNSLTLWPVISCNESKLEDLIFPTFKGIKEFRLSDMDDCEKPHIACCRMPLRGQPTTTGRRTNTATLEDSRLTGDDGHQSS